LTRLLWLCTALSLSAASSWADDVVLTNGDHLSGKLVTFGEGKLKLQSPLLGEVSVAHGAIAKLATSEAIEVHLADGTVVRDQLVLGDSGELKTGGSGSVTPQTFALADLTAINPPPEVPVRWHPDFALAAKAERGNSIKDEADLTLKALRESPDNRVWFLGTYEGERNTNRSTGESNTTDRKIEGELKYDQFLGERWYWFARTKATRDGPADLDLRYLAGAGPGYRVFKSVRTKLDLELGPVWVSENFGDATKDNDSAGALAAWRFTHKLSDTIELFSDLDWLITRWDDRFYVDSNIGARTHLSPRFYLETKIEWDYSSEPTGDVERQDTDYILGLGYRF
jgi:putative salt-induced outer membrane protein YdiY